MADRRDTPVPASRPEQNRASQQTPRYQAWAPGLSVWPVAQRSPAAQRRGRYVAGSAAHPARMLPDLAAHAIAYYTQPGDLVLDPLAGIGTTLVEAVHLGRDAVGVEYEPGWVALTHANITHAGNHGGTGHAHIVHADATELPDPLNSPTIGRLAGQVALVLTSPPYGRTMHGRVDHRHGPLTRFHDTYTDPGRGDGDGDGDRRNQVNLAHRGRAGLLAGLTRVLAGCLPLLKPDGVVVVTARPWRRNGLLVDLPGLIIDATTAAGLHPADRCVALLAAVRDDHLQPRHSFWQLAVTRHTRRAGTLLHLIAHEDVLVFRRPETRVGSGEPAGGHSRPADRTGGARGDGPGGPR
jgi:modification methylase